MSRIPPTVGLAAVATVMAIAPAGAGAETLVAKRLRWNLMQVGAGGRSLELRASGGGCDVPRPTAVARERARRIEITVTTQAPPPDAQLVCPAIAWSKPVRVALRHPVAGRRVTGPLRRAMLPLSPPTLDGRVRVPRLAGLAPADARAVLHATSLRVRLVRVPATRGLPRVVGEAPAVGARVRRGTTVTLRVAHA